MVGSKVTSAHGQNYARSFVSVHVTSRSFAGSRKGELTASPSGRRGYSFANTEVQKVEAQHHRKRGACYVCH